MTVDDYLGFAAKLRCQSRDHTRVLAFIERTCVTYFTYSQLVISLMAIFSKVGIFSSYYTLARFSHS